jgi:hypothetical protein
MITAAEWTEWHQRTAKDRPDEEAIADPLWRLRWLYTCKSGAKMVPFVPTPEQVEVIISIHLRGWRKLIIPKARQLGMSTVLALICLDFCLHVAGWKAALVDKTAGDAATKLDEKIEQVWHALPEEYREAFQTPKGYAPGGLAWKLGNDDVSVFEAGAGFRGGTLQFAWISEWGWVQANDATRSNEILTGTLPASELGITVVETTWEGGKAGDVWTLVEEALNTPEEDKGLDSWRVLFFGWHSCAHYTTEHGYVDEASADLLDRAEAKLGAKFSAGQRRWYAAARRKYKRQIFGEYPSTLDECWHAPVEGSIYGEELDMLRTAGRLAMPRLSLLSHLPLFTWSDLGARDTGVMLLAQPVGTDIHVLDYHAAEGEGANYWATVMMRWERDYKIIMRHFLPHDGGRRSINDAASYQDTLAKTGIRNTEVLPVTATVWWGINLMRDIMPRMAFHERCSQPWKDGTGKERMSLMSALHAYRKRPVGANGQVRDEPLHDESSNYADALRYIAESLARGVVPTHEKIGRELDSERKKKRQSVTMKVGG